MYCLLVTMYRLHCEYGWGRIRLMQYADRVHRILVAVGNDERSIDKLMEEVNDETGIEQIFTKCRRRSTYARTQ